VKVAGLVADLRGFEIELKYDHALLYITDESAFQEGNFLSDKGQTQWYVREGDSSGSFILSCALLGAITQGATGSGTLFTVTFRTQKQGPDIEVAEISLPSYSLRGILNQDIEVDQVNGASVNIETGSQSIELKLGWNLISSYIWPLDTDMEQVFADLISDQRIVKVQDEAGNALVYVSGEGWLNNLSSFDVLEGYEVQVNRNCTLYIQGCQVQLPLTIPLQTGWNIISLPYSSDVAVMPLLQSLIDANQLVKVQDEAGNAVVNVSGEDWLDNIGYFEPGKGYEIYVNCDTQLTYPELRETAKVEPHRYNNEQINPNHKLKFENR
jgi:hypothetical protein